MGQGGAGQGEADGERGKADKRSRSITQHIQHARLSHDGWVAGSHRRRLDRRARDHDGPDLLARGGDGVKGGVSVVNHRFRLAHKLGDLRVERWAVFHILQEGGGAE